jgi:shikimate kinase
MSDNPLKNINLFLIGMMGTGKTTIGEVLARRMGYYFFDTDALIERVSQRTIPDIFATEGEAGFREIESKILAEISAYTKSVIATGGGIVTKQLNWSYLHHGCIVWLDAPLELIRKRIAKDENRPLRANLEELIERRKPLYGQADIRIAIEAEQTPETIVDRILEAIPTILKTAKDNPRSP